LSSLGYEVGAEVTANEKTGTLGLPGGRESLIAFSAVSTQIKVRQSDRQTDEHSDHNIHRACVLKYFTFLSFFPYVQLSVSNLLVSSLWRQFFETANNQISTDSVVRLEHHGRVVPVRDRATDSGLECVRAGDQW